MPTDPLEALRDARSLLDELCADGETASKITRAADMLAEAFGSGHKVLACGNGGSACDAMHFCEELTGRFRRDRDPLPAIACVDPGHLTCTANDYGYDEVFARWVRGLGNAGDVLVVLSTSGNSPNVVRAVEAAHDRGLHSLGLLGKGGGELAGRCSVEWIVPGETAERIQELHMLILHTLIDQVEQRVLGL